MAVRVRSRYGKALDGHVGHGRLVPGVFVQVIVGVCIHARRNVHQSAMLKRSFPHVQTTVPWCGSRRTVRIFLQ